MALSSFALQVNASNCGHPISPNVERLKTSIYSPAPQVRSVKPHHIVSATAPRLELKVYSVLNMHILLLSTSMFRNFVPLNWVRDQAN